MKGDLPVQGDGLVVADSPVAGYSEVVGSSRRISWRSPRFRLLAHLLLIVVVALLLNLYPDRIGIYVSLSDPHGFVPVLAPGFAWHLPWLNAWWVLAFILTVLTLIHGEQPTGLRLARGLFRAFTILVLYRLIVGGPILAVDPLWMRVQGVLSRDVAVIIDGLFILLNGLLKVLLTAILLLTARRLYRSVRPLFTIHTAHEWRFSDERQPDDKRGGR